jgi:hypothetical protein
MIPATRAIPAQKEKAENNRDIVSIPIETASADTMHVVPYAAP